MNFEEFKAVYQKKKVMEVGNTASKQPLLSVFVQTYQQKEFIKDCLDGILMQQTDFPVEILIGEDNSQDGTREICVEYAATHPDKIRLFLHHRKNQIKILGEATGNFNAFYNLFSARGKYIAFCEGDDFWTDPLKLQKQVDFLEEHPEFIFCYHKIETIDENGVPLTGKKKHQQPEKDIGNEALLKGEYHPLLLSICYRNVIRNIPEEMTQVINIDTFILSLFGKYGKAKFLSSIKPAKYRKHKKGIWSKRAKRKKYILKIRTLAALSKFYLKDNNIVLYKWYRIKMYNYQKMLVFNSVKEGNLPLALKSYCGYMKSKFSNSLNHSFNGKKLGN